jgi:hypothetical protein
MDIERHVARGLTGAHEVERAQHAARMVPVAVRQHNRLDRSEVEAETLGVALERVGFRAGVEQHTVRALAAARRDQARKAVVGAADAAAAEYAHAVAAQPGELGFHV